MTMATLKLENLSPELLSQIEHLAQQNHCTVNQQAIALIEQSLNQIPNKDSSWSKRRQNPFKMPWQGEPRINLQKGKGGKAKPYQVKQVKVALLKLRDIQEGKDDE